MPPIICQRGGDGLMAKPQLIVCEVMNTYTHTHNENVVEILCML